LIGDGVVYLLGCNLQRIALLDDSFVLLGCEVNGLDEDRALYARLARGVAEAIPGLWGYVGVDLVVTDRGPRILEVNPRLTTSYVGLSRSLGANVAQMVVGLTEEVQVPPAACLHPHRVDVDLEQCRVA
jgi:predicted ATP-grasp superfamily ATP-dependent carboligase